MPPTTVRKKYGYTVSVIQGTNKVTACAKAQWGNIRDNSFILIDEDKVFYQVIDRKKNVYRKKVTVLNSNQLRIDENTGTTLGTDDNLSFRYREFQIDSVEINNKGRGYKKGDLLKPEGGICKYNSSDEIDIPAQCKVTQVDDEGRILSIELINHGLYNLPPDDSCGALSGSGAGALLSLVSSAKDIVSIEERGISLVELSENKSILHLNHPLPPRVQGGEIEVEKWELTLNRDYLGNSK
ncbi:hypothetical protein CL634_08030, partial [bacterium]|nr:hypothetical protein [bacterium]